MRSGSVFASQPLQQRDLARPLKLCDRCSNRSANAGQVHEAWQALFFENLDHGLPQVVQSLGCLAVRTDTKPIRPLVGKHVGNFLQPGSDQIVIQRCKARVVLFCYLGHDYALTLAKLCRFATANRAVARAPEECGRTNRGNVGS